MREPRARDSTALERWRRALPLGLLLFTTGLVYLPSLGGPLLGYDDDWLLTRNTLLHDPSLHALGRIWFDLEASTRLVLGAEYLPLRDTNLWLEARLWGLEALPLRLSHLVLYLTSIVTLRAALRRAWPDRIGVELATAVFALHPVHVETAAWLASRKDLLAMLFVALGLLAYTSDRRAVRWLTPLAMVAASLSKSMSVAAPLLLPTLDWLGRRRSDVPVLAVSVGAAALSLVPHLLVGSAMNMVTAPLGGSRFSAAISMGPVWLRYLGLLVWPPALSIVHDVPALTRLTPLAMAGYASLAGWAVVGVWLWRQRRHAVTLAALVWFLAPLLPVSQVAFPLQNAMADRYLFLSVMAIGLAVGAAVSAAWRRLPATAGRLLLLAVVLLLGVIAATAARRAELFADEPRLFLDAMAKAPRSPIPPYQYGTLMLERGRPDLAAPALEAARDLAAPGSDPARRATTNLARAYVGLARLPDAEHLLRAACSQWPEDPKQLANLARVVARQGREAEAATLFQELQRRFPRYLQERGEPRVGP